MTLTLLDFPTGKSYSMMGYGSDRGIIPLICEALFDRIKEREAAEEGLKFTVEVRTLTILLFFPCL
jgi:kinesin family protein 1